jgi:transposase
MGQVAIFSGAQRRRRWGLDEKRAVVEAAFAPGATVVHVARAADVAPGQIYRWRQELTGSVPAGFARVDVQRDERGSAVADPVLVVELSGAVVRIMAAAPPALAGAILQALR